MAEIEGLDLVIKSNVAGATAGLASVQKGLAATAVAASKTDSSLSKLSKGSNQANQALTNLGRVAQDAPFGFIGIANNINPLLESFQRLKTETGTTGGALKALGSSLVGPAGLGIAVSVVSSLLVVFGDRLFSSSKQTDEAKKAIDGYNESAAKEILQLNKLLIVAKDENQTREVRLAAVQKLKAEYPNYLKGLSDEQILAGNLGGAYEKINAALLAKASLQAAEDKIIPLLKQQVELQLELNKAQQTVSGLSNISDQELLSNQKTAKLFVERKQAVQDIVKNTEKEQALRREINNLTGQLAGILAKAAPLDLKLTQKTPKEIKDKFVRDFKALDAGEIVPVPVNVQFTSPDFKGGPLDFFKGKDLSIKTPEFFPAIQEQIQKTAELLTTVLSPAFNSVFDAISNGQNAFQALGQAIKKIVVDMIKAAVQAAIFSVIINAVTGGGGGLLKGFGGLFGKLSGLGNLIPHATGGIITKPLVAGQHLFGEAGKEAVIPLDRLNEFINPSNNFPQYLPAIQLRGETLRVLYQRANTSFNRNG